jgi:lipopolysaccharide export system permease protein
VIFRYILKEIIPQFFSTFIIFCSIIIISQLVRLSEVLVAFGLTAENVLLPFLYIILPFLTIIIPISAVFAVMIAFSRLSADGEYAAFLATGFSLRKAARPVVATAGVLIVVGIVCAMYLEAWGRREFVQFKYRKTQSEIDSLIRFKMQEGVFLSDFIGYIIYSEKISKDRSKLTNVMVAPGRREKDSGFFLTAPRAQINGSVEEGAMRMVFYNGSAVATNTSQETVTVTKFRTADIDLLRMFQQQIFGDDSAKDDYRSYPPAQLVDFVKRERKSEPESATYWKASYLLYSRVFNPISALAFALFGLVFGIQDTRRGKSSAYVLTLLAIMSSYVFVMAFKWLAENGKIGTLFAAWFPHAVVLAAATFMVYQRDRLPPGEPMLAVRNLPFFGQKYRRA